jgi:isopenicillin N synthase-like dioxygenase
MNLQMTIQGLTIPTIDIKPYHPLTSTSYTPSDRSVIAEALHIACIHVGFFYLRVDDFFTMDEMGRVLDVGREFFHAPEEIKEEVHVSKGDGSRGELDQ